MKRPPPRSPLFPYTTLFRSAVWARLQRTERGRTRAVDDHECPSGMAVRLQRRQHRDRKSTRLNSSHSQISYAVFCLKKKIGEVTRKGDTPTCVDLDSVWCAG